MNGEQRDLAAGLTRLGVVYQQSVVADGVGGPGMALRPRARVFRIAQVRQHVNVFRVQPYVQTIRVRMSETISVVYPQGSAVGFPFCLQHRLTVTPQMLACELEGVGFSDFGDFLGQGHGVLVKDVAAQSVGVVSSIVPGQSSHARVTVKLEALKEGGCVSYAAPAPRAAAVANRREGGVEAVDAPFNHEALLELGEFLQEVVPGVLGILRKDFRQAAQAPRPANPVASTFRSHTVAGQLLNEDPGDAVPGIRNALRFAFVYLFHMLREPRIEEVVQPLLGFLRSIQRNRGNCQGLLVHTRVAPDAAVLDRFQCFQQQVLFNMPTDHFQAALVAEFVLCALFRAKSD